MKKYLVVLFLITFIVPSVASASWWNPLSWRKNYTQTTEIIEPAPIQSNGKTISIPKASPKQVVESKVIEKIVEKPIIQTITVQDPALQKQINDLTTDNALLKSKIEELTQKIENKDNELQLLKSVPVFSKIAECKNAKEIFNSLSKRNVEIAGIRKQEIEEYHTSHENQQKYQKDIDIITNKYRSEIMQNGKKIKLAQNKIELYCD